MRQDTVFSDIATDDIDLLKKDGGVHLHLKASFQRNRVFLEAGDLIIQRGDLIRRNMSTGAQETYEVVDPGFHENALGIPRHYQMTVKPLGEVEAKQAVQHITNYISGHNARINQHSIDNSTNVVNVDSRTFELLAQLRSVMEVAAPAPERQSAIEVIEEVKNQIESGKPKRPVVTALLNSLPQVANVASIVSTLLSVLDAAHH